MPSWWDRASWRRWWAKSPDFNGKSWWKTAEKTLVNLQKLQVNQRDDQGDGQSPSRILEFWMTSILYWNPTGWVFRSYPQITWSSTSKQKQCWFSMAAKLPVEAENGRWFGLQISRLDRRFHVEPQWTGSKLVPNWFRNKVPTSFKYDFLAPYIEIHWMSRHVSVPNHPSLLFGSRIQRIHIWMSQRVVKNEKSKSWG